MHTTLAAQLAQLELGHLNIQRIRPRVSLELPEDDAVRQTLAAIWSDLFSLFPDTALEDEAEEIAWGLVNLFHRASIKRGARLDRGLIRWMLRWPSSSCASWAARVVCMACLPS